MRNGLSMSIMLGGMVLIPLASCQKDPALDRYGISFEVHTTEEEVTGEILNSDGKVIRTFKTKNYFNDQFSTDKKEFFVVRANGQSKDFWTKTWIYMPDKDLTKGISSFPLLGASFINDTIRPW